MREKRHRVNIVLFNEAGAEGAAGEGGDYLHEWQGAVGPFLFPRALSLCVCDLQRYIY